MHAMVVSRGEGRCTGGKCPISPPSAAQTPAPPSRFGGERRSRTEREREGETALAQLSVH